MKCEKIPKMDWDIFNERFEVYFFLYFIGYVLVWRLNYEYISAKYIHSLNVNGELQQDFNTSDSSGLVVPITATDLGSVYCNGSETTSLALDTTKITMKGIERETLKVYAALLIPSITVTFIYGIISDFTGKRKFMMSLSSFSNAIYALIIVLDFYIGEEIGQKNLIIGAFIAGCFGNWAATTVALTTYVADVTKPEERFLRMGIVILIMKLVYAACEGPLVYWIKTTGFQQPIWFTFAATGLACSIQIQIMDESQPMNRDYKDFNLGNFYYWLFTTKFKAVFDKYFFFLVISYSFLVFITEGYYMRLSYSTYSLIVCGNYNLPFGYMHYIAWNLIGSIGMILVLIPVFRKIPETLLAIIGMASIAAGLIFLPFCKEEWMYYTAFALMFLHQVPYTVFLTLSSKHTDYKTQAIALTVLYCCGGIAKLLALVLGHFAFYEVDNNDINDILLWMYCSLLVIPAGFLIVLWRKGEKTTVEVLSAEEDSLSIHDRDTEKLK